MKKILLALVGVIVVILLVAAAMPKDFKIEKEIVINKPTPEVFSYLKMVKNGHEWNPWMKKGANTDPSGVQTFKGEDGAVGFINSWSSNDKEVGVGEEEITAIVPDAKIELELRLVKPMKATNKVYFTTTAAGANQTKVTWTMEGRTDFPFNIICFFKQKEVGNKFVLGLENLKTALEK